MTNFGLDNGRAGLYSTAKEMKTFILMAALSGSIAAASAYGQVWATGTVDPLWQAQQEQARHNAEMERIARQQAEQQRQADEAQAAQLAQLQVQQQAELARQQTELARQQADQKAREKAERDAEKKAEVEAKEMERNSFLEAQAAGSEAVAAWYAAHGSAYAPQLLSSQKTRQQLVIGMTAGDVRAAWGAPEKVETLVSANGVREHWCYGGCAAGVTFQDGRVESFQQIR
jgi:hypothetical protein